MDTFLEEFTEEVTDFGEDFWEHIAHRTPAKPHKRERMVVGGVSVSVRPAYVFAERIDNILKAIFGISICISALTATFLGFTKLSDLLNILITTFWGRGVMFIIGTSYLILAIWKLMHLGKKE